MEARKDASLPLIALKASEVGVCALQIKDGRLQTNETVSKRVLNPFSYATKDGLWESVLLGWNQEAIKGFRKFKPNREWQSREDKDFAAHVMLNSNYDTLELAAAEGVIEYVQYESPQSKAGAQVDVMVFPAKGKPAFWMVVDGWHLSKVKRTGDVIEARLLRLQASYADLVTYFKRTSDAVRSMKFDFNLVKQILHGAGQAALQLANTAGGDRALRGQRRAERTRRRAKQVGIGAHAELMSASPIGASSAHSALPDEWKHDPSMDLGILSLSGCSILGITEASPAVKMVLGNYVLGERNHFEHIETVRNRVQNDTSLGETEKVEILNLIDRRGSFEIKGRVRSKRAYSAVTSKLLLVLETPVGGRKSMVLRALEPISGTYPILELMSEKLEDAVEKDGSSGFNLDPNKEAYRTALSIAGEPATIQEPTPLVGDRHKKAALLVALLEKHNNLKTMEKTFSESSNGGEYFSIADFFCRKHASNIEPVVLRILMTIALQSSTPLSSALTRARENLLSFLSKDKQQVVKAAAMGGKALGFLAEGIAGAAHEGFTTEAILKGLTYGFTWTYVSENGDFVLDLPFLDPLSILSATSDLFSLGPFFSALKVGYAMFDHAKHSFDSVLDAKAAGQVDRVSEITSSKNLMRVLSSALSMHVLSSIAPLRPLETERFAAFEERPLGIPAEESENAVPLATQLESFSMIEEWELKMLVEYSPEDCVLRANIDIGKEALEWLLILKDHGDIARLMDCCNSASTREGGSISASNGHIYINKYPLPVKLMVGLGRGRWIGTAQKRAEVATAFAAQCKVSGSESSKDSTLGVALSCALSATIVRALELINCTSGSPDEIFKALLSGTEELPVFTAELGHKDGLQFMHNFKKEFGFGSAKRLQKSSSTERLKPSER